MCLREIENNIHLAVVLGRDVGFGECGIAIVLLPSLSAMEDGVVVMGALEDGVPSTADELTRSNVLETDLLTSVS